MLLPDKITRYNASIFSRFIPVIQILGERNSGKADELYQILKGSFLSVSEFIQTLDALYALGKIDIDKNTGELICL